MGSMLQLLAMSNFRGKPTGYYGDGFCCKVVEKAVGLVCAQRESGVASMLRVAPLFETLEDLEHSESAMEQLLSDPWYAAHIKGEQECMIGYSDSGKDAGRMAAAWGLYEVQVGVLPFDGFGQKPMLWLRLHPLLNAVHVWEASSRRRPCNW